LTQTFTQTNTQTVGRQLVVVAVMLSVQCPVVVSMFSISHLFLFLMFIVL